MVPRIILLFVWTMCAVFGHFTPAGASEEFKKNNPDTGKFEFARSFISALSYVNAIHTRWEKTTPKIVYAGNDVRIMRGYVAFLIKDNADLRIAKNFLTKYLDSPNLLIRKTADTFIAVCLRQVAINDKEQQVWDQWYALKSNNMATFTNERIFVKTQEELSIKRKIAGQGIVEASVLLTKVLRSQRNADEKGRVLAVTAKQREILLERLDEFGRDTLAWGMKPGQDQTQASIAIIREILEDSVYTTLDE